MKPALTRVPPIATLLIAALALTACGGEDRKVTAPPPAPSAPASSAPAPGTAVSPGTDRPDVPRTLPSAEQSKALNAFTACMRKHGVDIPDGGKNWTPPPGYDQGKAQKALTTCMKNLEGALRPTQ